MERDGSVYAKALFFRRLGLSPAVQGKPANPAVLGDSGLCFVSVHGV